MKTIIGLSALGLLMSWPMAAQSTGINASAGFILGLDGLKKVTNASSGATASLGYDAQIPGSDIPARLGLAVAYMPGSARNYSLTSGDATTSGSLKTSLTLIQFSGDVLIATNVQGLSGVVGMSANWYSVSNTGKEDTSDTFATYSDCHYPLKDGKGLKLGFRLGLEYAFSKSWSGELLFQQTELAGADVADGITRRGGINPCWLQLGARYHF